MTTPRHRKLPAVVIGFLCSFVLAFAAPVKFEIPAQPAPAALRAFIKQSSTQVVFNPDELQGVSANEVNGEFEPAEALDALLKGTGFAAIKGKGGIFVVKKAAAPVTTGSLKGALTGEGGRGLANVLVSIRETSDSTETDHYGVYSFSNVAAGTYMLVASASGYQTMHITDVNVRAGRELTLGKEEMRRLGDGVLSLEPFVVHADTVQQLEKFEVTASKEKPFTTNMDISRTIDDVQPYYIFDAKTIDQSGAANVEDFLKQRLTMDTTALSHAQNVGRDRGTDDVFGNTSSINLRGLGADKTLILVNGRRIANVVSRGADYQPDLNGIPLNAIDRIEVLPSSASGIYGGGAIGGVINVVLKNNYSGGEIKATYANTTNTDSATRTVSASYGWAMEGGKTHVLISGNWSDANPLLLQDRRGIYEANISIAQKNNPNELYSSFAPFLGSTTNLRVGGLVPSFKDGTPLGSERTFISPGTAPGASASALQASLLANAGKWNFGLPSSAQYSTGLLRPIGAPPRTQSVQLGIRRQMLTSIELFADLSYNDNKTQSTYNSAPTTYSIRATAPTNPFNSFLAATIPDATELPVISQSTNRSATVGAIAKLPFDWNAELDYSISENRFAYTYFGFDGDAFSSDLSTGVVNPFVDTLLYPLDTKKYFGPVAYSGSSTLKDLALRGSGPLGSLPWGMAKITLGLEHRTAQTPKNVFNFSPATITTSRNQVITYFEREQKTDSVYAEITVPLAKRNALPFVHSLDLELSGRAEKFTVDTGTDSITYSPASGTTTVGFPNLNGEPFFSKASYTSKDGTIGVRFEPFPDLIFRASVATAFLPPAYYQLSKNPLVDPYLTTVTDPKNGADVDVETLSGGNPNVKPQSSESFDFGVIWSPHSGPLGGLRTDFEYYRIRQNNYIDALDAQTIVSLESAYPQRVSRNSSGMITQVDTTYLNLYKRETEGIDISIDYIVKTSLGTLRLSAAGSIVRSLKNQYSSSLPEYDAVDFPSDNGAARYKSNGSVVWEHRRWTGGWNARYFGSYKQYGSAGSPTSALFYGGMPFGSTIQTQGRDSVASQIYHDFFVGYSFGREDSTSHVRLSQIASSTISGLTLQFGIRNAFGKVPPFDAYYGRENYYLSPFGDIRLRSYWISVRKQF